MVTSREKPATRALSVCATECRVLGSMHHRTLAEHQHARPRQRRTRAIVTVRHVCLYSKRGRSVGRDHDAEGAEADVLFISASTRNLTDVMRVHGYDSRHTVPDDDGYSGGYRFASVRRVVAAKKRVLDV